MEHGSYTVMGQFLSCRFTEIHRSSLRKIEQIVNTRITKFYNSDDEMLPRQNFGKLKRG